MLHDAAVKKKKKIQFSVCIPSFSAYLFVLQLGSGGNQLAGAPSADEPMLLQNLLQKSEGSW